MHADGDWLYYAVAENGPSGVRREDELDLAAASPYELFFSSFLGDMRLRLDGLDFSTRFGTLATLPFALSLALRVENLSRMRRTTMAFQDRSGWICLLADGDTVCVATSYATGIAAVEHDRFKQLTRDAASDLVRRLAAAYPRLRDHEILGRMLAGMGFPPISG